MRFEEVAGLWDDGLRRMRDADPADRRALELVVDALVGELRRRLGGHFTIDELARLYIEGGTDWCFDVATRTAPANPAAWDMATVANAAFAIYVRGATDYGGGRRRVVDDDQS